MSRKFRIIVCIKQVPDTASLSIDPETGVMNRSGAAAVINALDRNALETALRIRQIRGGEVTALTMGPGQAELVLQEAAAMGADRTVLVSDKLFSGSDTWATSVILARAVDFIGGCDLIICGKQATDGDTAQVPAQVAGRLGLPYLPWINRIVTCGIDSITVESAEADRIQKFRSPLPAVISVKKNINIPRKITLPGWQRSERIHPRRLTNRELSLPEKMRGLSGSPTRVKRITSVAHKKKITLLDAGKNEDMRIVLELLNDADSRYNSSGRAADPSYLQGHSRILPQLRTPGEKSYGHTVGSAATIAVIGSSAGYTEGRTGHGIRTTLELLGKARELAGPSGGSVILILPVRDNHRMTGVPGYSLADTLYCVNIPRKNRGDVNALAALLSAALRETKPDIVLGAADDEGRAVMPLIASALETGLTADCTRLDIDRKNGLLLQTRPAFGGHITATIVCPEKKPQMATVRPHVFPFPGAQSFGGGMPPLFQTEAQCGSPVRVRTRRLRGVRGKDITDAVIIFAGGRGLGKRSGFSPLHQAASRWHAGVGASRSAVEAGWAPYSLQVGQTGKTVQPAVYIAAGISGAVQHQTGMHDSETIIAVNNDPAAPIFSIADYGFVADYRFFFSRLNALADEGPKES